MHASLVALAVVSLASCDRAQLIAAANRRWRLTWSDEFSGPAGSAPDPLKWTNEVGSLLGWGDGLQYYSEGTANASVAGGLLTISVTDVGASEHTCWYGTCRYTSARLVTKGKFAQRYGRFEARIRIPLGVGLQPAFWLLGADIDDVGWPSCGEIDVMENVSRDPQVNFGSLHGPGYAAAGISARFALPGPARLGDAFHVYAIEWDPTSILFLVDDVVYEAVTPADVATAGTWPFDRAFFIVLSVGVGGSWAGEPDATTAFPQQMLVDWVRVYASP